MIVGRDYSLTGADGRLAGERALALAEWYAAPIPRKRLKELMRRSDQPALRDNRDLAGCWRCAAVLAPDSGQC